MILIVGASGRLGQAVTRRLLKLGWAVRVMTRNPSSVASLGQLGAEVVEGDLRKPDSIQRACQGVRQVLAAAHALDGKGDNNPLTVDDRGNRCLIDASRAAGVKHFILVSALGASPESPLEFYRIKHRAEEYLRSSGLNFTILRPTAYMDLWGTMIGGPVLKKGQASIFGRGNNPINFVAVEDVADLICMMLENPQSIGKTIQVGGPESLTMNQVVGIFESLAGHPVKKRHVPLPVMRAMSVLMRQVNPTASRLIEMGVYMDTDGLSYDKAEALREFQFPQSRFEDWARGFYETRN